ncbi:MAG TPA: hypothetical protein VEG60_03700, partial [Candidatus Binatia bacterium]|nr:hypothetical protein [Candidatus Binatia bacterium]
MDIAMKANVLEKNPSGAGVEDESALVARIAQLEKAVEELKTSMPEDRATIVVFSGDLDKVLASF